MTRFLSAAAAVLAAAALVVTLLPSGKSGPSATRIAGAYVKVQAAQAGVRILGDKVWAVRKTKVGEVVVVRVKYLTPPQVTIFGPIPGQIGWVTLYVPLSGPPWSIL